MLKIRGDGDIVYASDKLSEMSLIQLEAYPYIILLCMVGYMSIRLMATCIDDV